MANHNLRCTTGVYWWHIIFVGRHRTDLPVAHRWCATGIGGPGSPDLGQLLVAHQTCGAPPVIKYWWRTHNSGSPPVCVARVLVVGPGYWWRSTIWVRHRYYNYWWRTKVLRRHQYLWPGYHRWAQVIGGAPHIQVRHRY